MLHILPKHFAYSFALSQQLRQTSLFTLSGDKEALFFWTMWPESENNLSQGTVVAGVDRYLRAMRAIRTCAPSLDDHHCSGHWSMLILGSDL